MSDTGTVGGDDGQVQTETSQGGQGDGGEGRDTPAVSPLPESAPVLVKERNPLVVLTRRVVVGIVIYLVAVFIIGFIQGMMHLRPPTIQGSFLHNEYSRVIGASPSSAPSASSELQRAQP